MNAHRIQDLESTAAGQKDHARDLEVNVTQQMKRLKLKMDDNQDLLTDLGLAHKHSTDQLADLHQQHTGMKTMF